MYVSICKFAYLSPTLYNSHQHPTSVTFISDYEYKIEYELKLLFNSWSKASDLRHLLHQYHFNSILSSGQHSGRNEGTKKVAVLKVERPTRTQSHTHHQIWWLLVPPLQLFSFSSFPAKPCNSQMMSTTLRKRNLKLIDTHSQYNFYFVQLDKDNKNCLNAIRLLVHLVSYELANLSWMTNQSLKITGKIYPASRGFLVTLCSGG